MIDEETNNPLKQELKPYLEEFRDTLLSTGFITDGIREYRNRLFSKYPPEMVYRQLICD